MSQRLTYIEIDLPVCSLVYGESPCTAAIGVTGEDRCYNTRKTCQDKGNYAETLQTIRFAVGAHYLPYGIRAIQNITDVSYTPGILSLGESIGARSTLTVAFSDHPTPDTGAGGDPYISLRDYDAYNQGTFWGKFKARQPYLRGRTLRWYNGKVGDSLETMEVRTFLIDSMTGLDASGKFTITAKDPLKLLDDKNAQAPVLSSGLLASGLTETSTSLTLSPSGIGDAEYPASGYASIAGNEIVSYTRTGDVLSITRAQLNTEAQEHDADDRVQVVLEYSSAPPDEIVYDLLVNYAEMPAEFINTANWQEEISTYLARTYSGFIAEPTGVVDLVNEILEQAAVSVWWDEIGQQIRMQVLRDITKDSQEINDDFMMADSFTQKDQPSKRVSQVWTYFGQINPLESQDDPTNYRSALSTVNLESETNYGTPSIKRVYSRWIPQFGRTTAERLNNLLLGRYSEPPKLFTFKLLRDSGMPMPALGGGYNLTSASNQSAAGLPVVTGCQAVKVGTSDSTWSVSAEEVVIADTVDPVDPTIKRVTIDNDANNVNLRNAFLSVYTEANPGDTIIFEIRENVVVGSANTTAFAIDTGEVSDWPSGLTFEMTIGAGAIVAGAGGRGGQVALTSSSTGSVAVTKGGNGGTALRARLPISITNNGIIGGGGGGGSASYQAVFNFDSNVYYLIQSCGGGGAGRVGGAGGTAQVYNGLGAVVNGGAGSVLSGGATGLAFVANDNTVFPPAPFYQYGGFGGALGADGEAASQYKNGSRSAYNQFDQGQAGNAVNGDSNITWTTLGDIRGARV